MSVLRARLLDLEQRKQEAAITKQRRSQVGTGDRAEKIRTYNFPQDRVTDHRIGYSLRNLPRILEGELDELIHLLVDGSHIFRQGHNVPADVFGGEVGVRLQRAKLAR